MKKEVYMKREVARQWLLAGLFGGFLVAGYFFGFGRDFLTELATRIGVSSIEPNSVWLCLAPVVSGWLEVPIRHFCHRRQMSYRTTVAFHWVSRLLGVGIGLLGFNPILGQLFQMLQLVMIFGLALAAAALLCWVTTKLAVILEWRANRKNHAIHMDNFHEMMDGDRRKGLL